MATWFGPDGRARLVLSVGDDQDRVTGGDATEVATALDTAMDAALRRLSAEVGHYQNYVNGFHVAQRQVVGLGAPATSLTATSVSARLRSRWAQHNWQPPRFQGPSFHSAPEGRALVVACT